MSNPVTEQILQSVHCRFQFRFDDPNGCYISDERNDGVRWPAEGPHGSQDFGIVAKLKMRRVSGSEVVYVVAAGIGAHGTRASCLYLEFLLASIMECPLGAAARGPALRRQRLEASVANRSQCRLQRRLSERPPSGSAPNAQAVRYRARGRRIPGRSSAAPARMSRVACHTVGIARSEPPQVSRLPRVRGDPADSRCS